MLERAPLWPECICCHGVWPPWLPLIVATILPSPLFICLIGGLLPCGSSCDMAVVLYHVIIPTDAPPCRSYCRLLSCRCCRRCRCCWCCWWRGRVLSRAPSRVHGHPQWKMMKKDISYTAMATCCKIDVRE